MSNAERLAAALEGVFPAGVETGVDASTIDRMIESLAPLVSPNFAGGSMTARGGVAQRYDDAVGLQSAWVDWVGGFESVSLEGQGVEPVGENAIFVARQVGTTRHGVAVEQPSAAVFKFSDGQITRVEFHLDRAAALASAREPA